jgi:hypothetical protein
MVKNSSYIPKVRCFVANLKMESVMTLVEQFSLGRVAISTIGGRNVV